MTERALLTALVAVCLCAVSASAGPDTRIYYDLNPVPDSSRWEYVYTIENIDLSGGIEEFTIWFDYGLYENLTVTTPETMPDWDAIVWQPEPIIGSNGGYDGLAMELSIGMGESLRNISVSFDWLGTGDPGSQYYEIIDSSGFVTIEDGWTVPEPMTLFFTGLGSMALLRIRHKNFHIGN